MVKLHCQGKTELYGAELVWHFVFFITETVFTARYDLRIYKKQMFRA